MMIPLHAADAVSCGGKAAALGALLRHGLPVPEGFVIPFGAYRAAIRTLDLPPVTEESSGRGVSEEAIPALPLSSDLVQALTRSLDELGDPMVAVRSSSDTEDNIHASGAGQHESVLGVRGAARVGEAVQASWASLYSTRAIAYRDNFGEHPPTEEPAMAVLVQRLVDADVSGVMFTPAHPEDVTEIEASWGLGPSVVGGTVTPDAFHVSADESIVRTIAHKQTRLDRDGERIVTSEVPERSAHHPTLDDAAIKLLTSIGRKIAKILDSPQDIEWAIQDHQVWILQARPITVTTPRPSIVTPAGSSTTLRGTPGSAGISTGPARVIEGPADFARVRAGDILICPYTDPAWTPLLRIAAGVVTETGGVLSHAAIVARELGIPAVLGIPAATTTIHNETEVTVDGAAGTVTPTHT